MRLYTIILTGILLTGCASSTLGEKRDACETKFTAFADIVSCTKESSMKVKDDFRVKLYLLKGDQLVEKLKNREISEIDAKTEWQELYVKLKSAESSERREAIREMPDGLDTMPLPQLPQPVLIQTPKRYRCITRGSYTTCE